MVMAMLHQIRNVIQLMREVGHGNGDASPDKNCVATNERSHGNGDASPDKNCVATNERSRSW